MATESAQREKSASIYVSAYSECLHCNTHTHMHARTHTRTHKTAVVWHLKSEANKKN